MRKSNKKGKIQQKNFKNEVESEQMQRSNEKMRIWNIKFEAFVDPTKQY